MSFPFLSYFSRLCMDDAPVPYASSMEQVVVKRASDLIAAVYDLTGIVKH